MHTDTCPWKNEFEDSLTDTGFGVRSILRITREGIEYIHNVYKEDPTRDYSMDFKFCPMCGTSYTKEK